MLRYTWACECFDLILPTVEGLVTQWKLKRPARQSRDRQERSITADPLQLTLIIKLTKTALYQTRTNSSLPFNSALIKYSLLFKCGLSSVLPAAKTTLPRCVCLNSQYILLDHILGQFYEGDEVESYGVFPSFEASQLWVCVPTLLRGQGDRKTPFK
ncbi:hypothetical protein MHYP_G00300500 [Metynnis hypsauchen]